MNETEALRFAANILRTLSVTAEPGKSQAALTAARMLDDYYAEEPPAVPAGAPPWPWERDADQEARS
jgi:hypothetical protein